MELQALLGARILKVVTVRKFAGLRVDRVQGHAMIQSFAKELAK